MSTGEVWQLTFGGLGDVLDGLGDGGDLVGSLIWDLQGELCSARRISFDGMRGSPRGTDRLTLLNLCTGRVLQWSAMVRQ